MSIPDTSNADAGPVVIRITVPGRFDGSTVALVRQALHAVIEESSADVALDLSADWIDVPALAVLAHAHQRLRAQDRRLVVCASSDRVRRVLAVTGLNRVIPVQPRIGPMVA
jgi:anti-anti-sigma factor